MNNINDTYLVVNIETKEVFGHYDTPGKANGQVKRKGDGYAVYVVSEVHPLIPPKRVIEDFTEVSWIKNLEDCMETMESSMIDNECEEAGFAQQGNSEVTDIFKYQGKYYEITVEIDWNRRDKQFYFVECSRVKSCVEVEYSE